MDNKAAKDLVRRGYNALSHQYEQAYDGEAKYGAWIAEVLDVLPASADVLDLGCGNGIPVARSLATAGHHVTGVDISEVQIDRARELVPAANFICADATSLGFPDASFDAVVSFYALIHVPVEEQLPLIQQIAAWLRPGGRFVGTTGHGAWTGTEENWLGGEAAMWWSQADAATSLGWLADSGLIVDREEFVPEGDAGHTLFWAHRP
ncbi:MAG TPA: class I SAM-dependent methyltransferase [Kribbella sp.]|uniref:class I SAM-dependent methyltransferase n=1 Tax=Kribbella sp. TaxID=1871183 RepID=UPI002D7864CA|nr:class I SAM-dependent methyltransferase [Kribbella sp.]HET6299397.1 class I SAM-dependent methyltransferase [Kribbella sp.]